MVLDSVSAARRGLWADAIEHRPNYGGISSVDEETSVALYKKKVKVSPMVAGALHTILADGVWTPSRAKVRGKKSDGKCALRGMSSGTEHVFWERPAVHKNYDPRRFALSAQKDKGVLTSSLALAGVAQGDFCTLGPSEAMKSGEMVGAVAGGAATVYIDGSAYSAGGTKFAGWGVWFADNADFCVRGPLLGRGQSSDRAEVRALVAAVEAARGRIDVGTDNMYVKDRAGLID